MKQAVEEKGDGGSESGATWRRGVLSKGLSRDSDSGVFIENTSADSPKDHKSRSGPEFLGLSRCAACYNQQEHSMPHRGDDGSSSDDSGREFNWDSEDAESSSNSSCSSEPVSVGLLPKSESGSGGVFEPGSEERDGAGLSEQLTGQGVTQEEMEGSQAERMARRAPLVKSFSLPSSLSCSLLPLSFLPRPPSVVSTLHLQVLPGKDDDGTFHIKPTFPCQPPSGREGARKEEWRGGNDSLLPPQPSQLQQMGLPWQQTSLQQPANQQHQYQQQQWQQNPLSHHYPQQQQFFFPTWRPGYPPPLPPHTFPVLHPPTPHTPPHASYRPQTHPHTHTPQTCFYCYNTPRPVRYTYWSPYTSNRPNM